MEADRPRKVASHLKAYIVPDSQKVGVAMVEKGYVRLLQKAEFLVLKAGCSMNEPRQIDRPSGVCFFLHQKFQGLSGFPA